MTQPSLRQLVRDEVKKVFYELHWEGIVTGTSGNKVLVKRLWEADADAKPYAKDASYSATVGHRVIMLDRKVLGRILR